MFDQPHASSDGGAMLLKAADARLGVTAAVARCLTDGRASSKITHTIHELVAQRVFGIACGYPDANDADRLVDDPIQKLLLDRDPITGLPLASQPTLWRLRMAWGARRCIRRDAIWRSASSPGTSDGCTGVHGASRSI